MICYAPLIVGSILDFPLKLGKKKMQESRSMPPRELDSETHRDKHYNSSASLPPKRLSTAENLGSQNGIHYSSSETHSGEIQVEDSPFDEKIVHSFHLLAASGILEMVHSLSLSLSLSLSHTHTHTHTISYQFSF